MRGKKFKNTMYARVYELARNGFGEKKIAALIGVSYPTFNSWRKKDPAFHDAIVNGRAVYDGNAKGITFQEFVYNALSPDLKKLWDEINACEEEENGVLRLESLLEAAGKKARQHLFLYALTTSCFNVSGSLKKLNIPKKTLDKWVKFDPKFAELVDEIHWHKKNFFEHALIDLVAARDPSAVLFANKTVNRDRGYHDKVDVTVAGQIQHAVAHIRIDELDLPLEMRKALLAKFREKKLEASHDTPNA